MCKKIYIRADGDGVIGLGHLVRCVALAQMLANNFKVSFVCKEIPESIVSDLEVNGLDFIKILEEDDFISLLKGNEIVILDGYHFDSDFQKYIKTLAYKLVCIDDLYDREFFADLVINHAPNVSASDYAAQPYTQFALGTDFVLLRDAFLKQAKVERKVKQIENVIICFGGADIYDLTRRALEVVVDDIRFKSIKVVTGSAYKWQAELDLLSDSDDRISLFNGINETEMLAKMIESDLAIVPSSGVLIEALAAGCTVISGMYIENQKHIFSQYRSAGLFESAEDFSVSNLIHAVNAVFNTHMSRKINHKSIDGNSGIRLLNTFKQLSLDREVKFRRADSRDIMMTFEWASDSIVRAFSFNRDPIKFTDHEKWFTSKIESKECYYFIGEWQERCIGSIRYDVTGSEAIISFLVAPEFHGLGFGMILLRRGLLALMAQETPVRSVVGYVMPENIASVKAFERSGYAKVSEGKNFKFVKLLN